MFEQCLYFNSNALARTVERIWTDAYRPFGLSPAHAFLLRAVLARPGMLAHELAETLHLSRSTVTRFLDSLEQRGFLLRKPAAEDARQIQIFPTAKAKALHQKLDKTGAELSKLMSTAIGQDMLSTTVARLRKIQQRLNTD